MEGWLWEVLALGPEVQRQGSQSTVASGADGAVTQTPGEGQQEVCRGSTSPVGVEGSRESVIAEGVLELTLSYSEGLLALEEELGGAGLEGIEVHSREPKKSWPYSRNC